MMNKKVRMKKGLVLLWVIVLVTGCGASYSVFHDANPNADFSGLKTYTLVYAGQEEIRSDISKRTIETSIQQLMEKRGYTLSSESPNLVLAYDGRVRQKKEVSVTQDPVMYGPRWGYYGWNNYEYREYEVTEGTLVIDFVAAGTNELLWQGGVSSNIDPVGAKSEELKKAVRLIFLKFPYEAGSGEKIPAAKAKALSTYEE